ncbi:hypothetical protein Rsub_02219 [Raphidocelis subcapitata]|uniref:SGNH hydrolase-type esterase domain-containing protein n=1 Tax=Raphidocelis subcapitata TaxID=307507 RepID=A0A2V0NRS1_9CHLO|nr:hypothetical protein Rsub_02219 [Raphidocelis subcapitata]|eukprot:GBF89342.1 hypothetical protein Rsub_02219 [Raphidocelis subcapitata]
MARRRAATAALLLATALLLAAAASAAARELLDSPQSPRARRAAARRRRGSANSVQDVPKSIRLLALGDSITMGSVPSANQNHPYTIELERRLREKLGTGKVTVTNAGVGGAGIFAVGFQNPTTLGPYAQQLLAKAKYDWIVGLIGINDLLRMGRSADDVFKGIMEIYKPALEAGTNVLAIAPLAAPGFVSRSDSKEGERLKLHALLAKASSDWNAAHPTGPRFAVYDLGIKGPMNFWDMGEADRRWWLDDGLHLTAQAYDRMGNLIADNLIPQLRGRRKSHGTRQ